MADNVREKAEALARDLFTNGAPRRYAYLVLRDTPGNQPGEGGSWSERAMADRIAAALAVAPATAQPGAYGYMVIGVDYRREFVRFNDDMDDSECESALESADLVCRAMNESEFSRAKPYRVVPLYAAPPAPGDAAAVALLADARKCVALANTNGYYDVWLARCDAILRPASGQGGACG